MLPLIIMAFLGNIEGEERTLYQKRPLPVEVISVNKVAVASTSSSPDFDGNGMVEFPDFVLFVRYFGTSAGEADYSVRYDLNRDGTVDFADFAIFARAFGTEVEQPSGLAPVDLAAFYRRAENTRILAETYFIDILSGNTYTEGFPRRSGRYQYERIDDNTGHFIQFYNNTDLWGGKCTIVLNFNSKTSGTTTYECADGSKGGTEDWKLSSLRTPLLYRVVPDTIIFAFRITATAGQIRAIDSNWKVKSSTDWDYSCGPWTNSRETAATVYLTKRISKDVQSETTYQYRYRFRNSDSCDSGTPDPWSPIVEGVTMASDQTSGGTVYGVGETIPGFPRYFVIVRSSSGARVVVSITGEYLQLAPGGGYVEMINGNRYTCISSVTCHIGTNPGRGRVQRGRVRWTQK